MKNVSPLKTRVNICCTSSFVVHKILNSHWFVNMYNILFMTFLMTALFNIAACEALVSLSPAQAAAILSLKQLGLRSPEHNHNY